jgi:hypothetical protein
MAAAGADSLRWVGRGSMRWRDRIRWILGAGGWTAESGYYFPRVVTHRRNRWAPVRVLFSVKILAPMKTVREFLRSVCSRFLGWAFCNSPCSLNQGPFALYGLKGSGAEETRPRMWREDY